MSLYINHNLASNNAQRTVSGTNRSLQSSFEKVSSGLRINKAADDAAGLGVAENLNAHYRSSKIALRNTNDGISVVQTAEGATNEVSNIIKRMRELAVQSASDTLGSTERQYIQDEYEELASEIVRIANITEFNGVSLGNGDNSTLNVQVGVENTAFDRISITLGDLRATVLGIDTGTVDLSTASGAQSALSAFDDALDSVNAYRSDYGATQNRLMSSLRNSEIYSENLQAAESRIRDADYAYETAEMAKYQILQSAGISVLAQAKAVNQGVLSLLQ